MGIPFTIMGKDELIAKYKNAGQTIASRLAQTMKNQMVRTADYARANKLSGNPLNRRTGALSRSVAGESEIQGSKVIGTLFSKGVKYAAVHELGGIFQIPTHERTINMVFGKPVAPHTIQISAYTATYPQRAFLRPSLLERQSAIVGALRQTVLGTLKNGT